MFILQKNKIQVESRFRTSFEGDTLGESLNCLHCQFPIGPHQPHQCPPRLCCQAGTCFPIAASQLPVCQFQRRSFHYVSLFAVPQSLLQFSLSPASHSSSCNKPTKARRRQCRQNENVWKHLCPSKCLKPAMHFKCVRMVEQTIGPNPNQRNYLHKLEQSHPSALDLLFSCQQLAFVASLCPWSPSLPLHLVLVSKLSPAIDVIPGIRYYCCLAPLSSMF